VDPYSIRSARISDPHPIRDNNGRPVHLVCVELNAKNRLGAYTGLERVPFAIADGVLSVPHDRKGVRLMSGDCYRYPVNLRPFPELEKIS
jgi:hypothetical protein